MFKKLFGERAEIVRHCTIHTSASALPSFIFALIAQINSPAAICGMFIGILTFLVCAVLIHLAKPMHVLTSFPTAARAITLGKKIRLFQALIAVPTFLLPGRTSIISLPDMYAGFLAIGAVNYVRGTDGIFRSVDTVSEQFLTALLATFVEGWILAAALAVLCFGIWVIMRIVQRFKPSPAEAERRIV